MLSDVVQHHLLGNRRDSEQPRVAPESLDVALLGVAHAAKRLYRAIGGERRRVARHPLRHIGFAAVGLTTIVERGGLVIHQPRTFELNVRFAQRKLQTLIGADWLIAKDLSLARVANGEPDRQFSGSDEAGGGDDPLRIENVQQFAKAAVQRADEFVGFDAHVAEKDGAGRQRIRAELVDGMMREPLARAVDHEEANAVGLARRLLELLGAGHHQDFRRLRHCGDPDLLPVEPPALAVASGEGLDRERIRSRVRFGERHGEHDLARGEARKERGLRLVACEAGQRHAAENRVAHEELAERRATACGAERFDRHRHVEHAEAGAAVAIRNRDRAQASVADRLPGGVRKLLLRVEVAPVVQPVFLADPSRGLDKHPLLFARLKVHRPYQSVFSARGAAGFPAAARSNRETGRRARRPRRDGRPKGPAPAPGRASAPRFVRAERRPNCADAEDRGLSRIDDGDETGNAKHADVRDRDRSAFHIVEADAAFARRLHQPHRGRSERVEAEAVDAAHHGRHQPARRIDGEADIDSIEKSDVSVPPGAVAFRRLVERASDHRQDEMGQAQARALRLPVHLVAEFEQAGDVGLGEHVEVRRVALRFGETARRDFLDRCRRAATLARSRGSGRLGPRDSARCRGRDIASRCGCDRRRDIGRLDAAIRPRSRNDAQIDVMRARLLARERRCDDASRLLRRLRRGLRRRPGPRGPSRDSHPDRRRLAFSDQDFSDAAGRLGGDVVSDLLGLHDEQNVAGLDLVARRHTQRAIMPSVIVRPSFGMTKSVCAARPSSRHGKRRPSRFLEESAEQPSCASLVSSTRPIILCSWAARRDSGMSAPSISVRLSNLSTSGTCARSLRRARDFGEHARPRYDLIGKPDGHRLGSGNLLAGEHDFLGATERHLPNDAAACRRRRETSRA